MSHVNPEKAQTDAQRLANGHCKGCGLKISMGLKCDDCTTPEDCFSDGRQSATSADKCPYCYEPTDNLGIHLSRSCDKI